jgi:deoxyribonuclease IV
MLKKENKIYIGCHISIAEGIESAPEVARNLGCDVMQIFTRSPHGGPTAEIKEDSARLFKNNCKKFSIKNVYVHTPYFINLASGNNRIYFGSINAIRVELERASLLGVKYVMTHIGSAKDLGKKEAIKKAIKGIEKALENYKGSAELLIENSAGAGEILGADFKEIGVILDKLNGFNKLAGVCLDTQHSFASGYDWKGNFANSLKKLKDDIGFTKIKLIHSNDSMTETGSKKDRHHHIGKGKIGIEAFSKIAEFAKKVKADMICETQYPEVKEDIRILQNLIASKIV